MSGSSSEVGEMVLSQAQQRRRYKYTHVGRKKKKVGMEGTSLPGRRAGFQLFDGLRAYFDAALPMRVMHTWAVRGGRLARDPQAVGDAEWGDVLFVSDDPRRCAALRALNKRRVRAQLAPVEAIGTDWILASRGQEKLLDASRFRSARTPSGAAAALAAAAPRLGSHRRIAQDEPDFADADADADAGSDVDSDRDWSLDVPDFPLEVPRYSDLLGCAAFLQQLQRRRWLKPGDPLLRKRPLALQSLLATEGSSLPAPSMMKAIPYHVVHLPHRLRRGSAKGRQLASWLQVPRGVRGITSVRGLRAVVFPPRRKKARGTVADLPLSSGRNWRQSAPVGAARSFQAWDRYEEFSSTESEGESEKEEEEEEEEEEEKQHQQRRQQLERQPSRSSPQQRLMQEMVGQLVRYMRPGPLRGTIGTVLQPPAGTRAGWFKISVDNGDGSSRLVSARRQFVEVLNPTEVKLYQEALRRRSTVAPPQEEEEEEEEEEEQQQQQQRQQRERQPSRSSPQQRLMQEMVGQLVRYMRPGPLRGTIGTVLQPPAGTRAGWFKISVDNGDGSSRLVSARRQFVEVLNPTEVKLYREALRRRSTVAPPQVEEEEEEEEEEQQQQQQQRRQQRERQSSRSSPQQRLMQEMVGQLVRYMRPGPLRGTIGTVLQPPAGTRAGWFKISVDNGDGSSRLVSARRQFVEVLNPTEVKLYQEALRRRSTVAPPQEEEEEEEEEEQQQRKASRASSPRRRWRQEDEEKEFMAAAVAADSRERRGGGRDPGSVVSRPQRTRKKPRKLQSSLEQEQEQEQEQDEGDSSSSDVAKASIAARARMRELERQLKIARREVRIKQQLERARRQRRKQEKELRLLERRQARAEAARRMNLERQEVRQQRRRERIAADVMQQLRARSDEAFSPSHVARARDESTSSAAAASSSFEEDSPLSSGGVSSSSGGD